MKFSHTQKHQMLNTIWDKFYQKLYSYINLRLSDNIHTDDILQDIFIKIYENLESLNDFNKIESWIIKIAKNKLTDYYRKKGLNTFDINKMKLQNTEDNKPEDDIEIKKENVVSGLKMIIDGLPEKYATALQKVEIEGKRQVHFANELGISISGAKSRVQRGRKKLKEALENCCNFEYDKYGNILDYQPRNI